MTHGYTFIVLPAEADHDACREIFFAYAGALSFPRWELAAEGRRRPTMPGRCDATYLINNYHFGTGVSSEPRAFLEALDREAEAVRERAARALRRFPAHDIRQQARWLDRRDWTCAAIADRITRERETCAIRSIAEANQAVCAMRRDPGEYLQSLITDEPWGDGANALYNFLRCALGRHRVTPAIGLGCRRERSTWLGARTYQVSTRHITPRFLECMDRNVLWSFVR